MPSVRHFGAAAALLFGMLDAGCGTGTTTQPICAGTGVVYQGAAQQVDLGDLVGNPSTVFVSLRVGQLLFLGANDCAHYQLTPAGELGPILQQHAGLPAAYAADSLAVLYQAASVGTVVISIHCSPSTLCSRATMSIDVSVS